MATGNMLWEKGIISGYNDKVLLFFPVIFSCK